MKIGIVMDPIEHVDPQVDSTYALGLEATRRGYQLFYLKSTDLWLAGAQAMGSMRPFTFLETVPNFDSQLHWRWLGETVQQPLDELNYVLMRKDPPFDANYIFNTHMLSFCKKAKVVNSPKSIREAPEKIYPLHFDGVFPPTVITSQIAVLKSFSKQHSEIIMKPLDGNGGRGVLKFEPGDKNFNSAAELLTQNEQVNIVAQQYLSAVRMGDKRIICINGEAVGAILRIPAENENRANIHVGAKVQFSKLNERDQWLVDQISPRLQQDELFFVGLDVIGEYLTEINVTSPTGIQEIKRLGQIDIAAIFWDQLILKN